MAEFQSFSQLSQKPTIFIFSTAYLPMIGGAELAIKEITDRLPDYFDFILFTARFSRTLARFERIGAVDVYRLGFGASFDKYLLPILGYFKARSLGGPQLLWGVMASYGSIAAYLLKRSNPGLKFLLTLQEGDPEEYLTSGRLGLMGFWLGRLIKSANQVQVISFYLKKLAVKFGANFITTEVVPNGVDLSVFEKKFSPENLRELKIRHGINDKQKVVITASRLVRKNGLDILIKAIAEIHDAHLFIAGTGPEEKKLKELAGLLKLEKRTHFMGDIAHGALSKYYALSHVFVRPSRSEGLGSAFLEAMGAGLPVIGTNIGGIPDFLENGKTGLFCEVDDPHDLAVKIKRFIHDEDFRKNIAEKAQEVARQNYSWDKIARKMGSIFYRLMHTK
ncbi:MAG: glycosyltransferase family 4 protein [Patescibacteria group bacterium]